MFDHVLSLSFGTAQVCGQAKRYTEFTNTYVKKGYGYLSTLKSE